MITVKGLSRSYGDFLAVDQVSFDIHKGEIIGLLGHNGAGKTTIMKMLTGYLEPDKGRIEVDGLDINEDRATIQHWIGYLPENCPVYPEMTVIDYLEYIAALHGLDAEREPEAVAWAIRETRLEPKAGEMINTLSRGYRQRVGVAQAILHRPRILILDEPTNGLDPSQIHHMRTLIRTQAEHATVIISTHILQEVQAVCDRAIIINNGRIALDARLDELQAGQRLEILLADPPPDVEKILTGIPGVTSASEVEREEGRVRYLIEPEGSPQTLAPRVAREVVEKGLTLLALSPEQRDLESVFREISSGVEGDAEEEAEEHA